MDQAEQVIIGSSAAGLSALEAIRKIDRQCPIILISKEVGPPYSRVALTHYIAGEIKFKGMRMRDGDYYGKMGVKALLGKEVVSLDTARKCVTLDDGSAISYDKLLIATGSKPLILPIEGTGRRGVYTCLSSADARKILRTADLTEEVVVIGAGLIGIQAADGLYRRGLQVSLVEKLPQVLPLMIDETAAGMAEAHLREKGIRVRTGQSAQKVLGKGPRVSGVALESGEIIPCQMVIMAAGVAPNVDFLQGSGVTVNRGILVDERQQTNIPGIYAAGDVAETVDLLSGERVVNAIWPEALFQGEIAGLNMAGVPATYQGSLAMNVTSFLGLSMASLGLWEAPGSPYEVKAQTDKGRRTYRKLVFRDGKLVGAVLVGHIEEAGVLHAMIRAGTTFDLKGEDLLPQPITWGRILLANALPGRG